MTKLKEKWLVITNKTCKSQVKREVERILKGATLQMMHPTYTQQGTIAKEYHSILVTLSLTLKSATGNGLEITNVATYRQRKKIAPFDSIHWTLNHTQNYYKRNKTMMISKMIKKTINYQMKQH